MAGINVGHLQPPYGALI